MMRAIKFWLLALVIIGLMVGFLFVGADFDFTYIIPKRLMRLSTIFISSICVATSSIVFQTIVGNRILSPAVMGYEAVYLLWQVLILFVLGTQGLLFIGVTGNFVISSVLMLLYSWLILRWLLPLCHHDIFSLLLIGLVLTMVISTITQFIQLRISPGEFSVFQGFSYATFNRAKPETLILAIIMVAVVGWLARKTLPILDVMVLGREQAMSLGVDHHHYVKLFLAVIAILVTVSTSLIGPTAFMGIFIANIAYTLAGSHQHKLTLPVGIAVAMSIFLLAQLMVEHVFNYKTSVSILVNLVCGVYFLILITRVKGSA